ncbi:hypothetical protein F5X96DRAFT_641036 [Biscogniauxia mediterranea]|nr:hypothetical protein F5X96DRAFT_641036 [Biscogniauxia mediterranea]
MYTVPLNRLGAFQYTQRIIAIDYQVGVTEPQRVQKDLRMLQAYFVNTQKRGLYQWPQAWIKFLMKPLLKRLKDLGLPQEEAKMKLSPENPRQYQPSQPRPAQEEPNQGLTDDTEMDIDDARESEPGTEIKMDDTQQKELRVLAYSAPLVVERSKDKGIDCRFWSFKQFVEVDGPNPLKVKRASEVSGVEILRCVDSKEVYNIKEKEGMYCTLPRSDFMGIEGVTWQPETGSDERTCWTWVLVKIRNINDHRPILSRTALRNWQGKKRADKEIDKFVVWLKIVPPWSPQVVKNPYHQQSYALVHQLPKKRKDNYYYDDDDGDDDMLVRRTRGHRDPALVTVIGDVADLKTAIMDIQRGMQKLLNSS